MLRNLNKVANGARVLGIPYVGVLASEMPTGFDLPGLLNNDVDAGDPANTRYLVQIKTWPSAGTLQVDENGAFVFSGAADGTYTGTETVTKFSNTGVLATYDTTYSFTVGSNGTVTVTIVSADGRASGVATCFGVSQVILAASGHSVASSTAHAISTTTTPATTANSKLDIVLVGDSPFVVILTPSPYDTAVY